MVMLYLLFGISILLIVLCVVCARKSGGEDTAEVLSVLFGLLGGILFFVSVVAFFIFLDGYNETRSTIEGKIAVCEESKSELIQELDGTIAYYCGYESEFYEEFRQNPEKALFAIYPKLKADNLFVSKMQAIQEYNKCIMNLKMEKVDLKSYKLWIGDMDWFYGREE
jgi:hypothetical protein